MRNINKVLLGATVVAAGFATVGAGAGADFVDSPSVHQTVSTGTILIDVTSGGQTSSATAGTPASLSLSPLTGTKSTFSYFQTITATNHGTISGTVKDIELATSGDVNPLANDVHMSVAGPNSVYTCSGSVAHCTGTNLVPAASFTTLAPGQSLVMYVATYAGGASGAPALTNVDEGKSLNWVLNYTVSS
jgi:hypothetical protein